MYHYKKILIYCFLIVFLCRNCVFCSKLNLPRVLLPLFSDFSTNFTLEVHEGGCYKWRASRLDVIQLLPVEEDVLLSCSTKAVLTTISKELTRNIVTVFAEDISTGQVLRCDVIVNVISLLSIVGTTKELFMEEAPEKFEVRAYDDQGNEFSTLEGVEFDWTIGNWNDYSHSARGSSVLRFISFRDSPYESPSGIVHMEKLGMRGNIVLIEGIKTGSAKVSVQMRHPEYRDVPPSEVQLIVVANLLIDPPDAYIILGDTIRYKLLQVQNGKLEEIRLPSVQYVLEVEDTDVAEMDKTSSLVRGLQLGRTKIILTDRNVDSTELGAIRLPSATLTVSTPAYLTLSLLPHHNWAVLVSHMCTIVIELFDSENHKMCIGESTTLVTTIPSDKFELHDMTRNGSYVTGIAVRPGIAPVVSTLESIRGARGEVKLISPAISAQADLEIYPRLAIKPSEIILLWYPPDSSTSKRNEATLNATGGDGVYVWSSGNQSVAIVTQTGIVRAQGLGSTEVVVTMQKNQHNHDKAKVHVLPPVHMEIVEYVQEAEVGAPIFIHVAMFAQKQVFSQRKKIPFTHCQDLPFKVKVWEGDFYYNSSEFISPAGIACATVAIIGKTVGSTKITISYVQNNIELESSTVVAAYLPITVLHPASGETVLAVGASRHIVWTGGPRPWMGRNFKHSHALSTDHSIIQTQELFNNEEGTYVYNIVCVTLGEADATLTVENKPSIANWKGAASTSTVKVFCSKPRFISLSAHPVTPLCPTNLNTDRIVAHCRTPLKLIITIKDDQLRIFDNATSFDVNWVLNKRSLATVSHRGHVLLEEQNEVYYTIPLDHYQMIIPHEQTGIIKVSVSVVGYHGNLLDSLNIIPESPPFAITNDAGYFTTPTIETSLMIVLVNDTIIMPNQTSIFNHPTNKVILKVSEGSGHFKVVLNMPDVASVTYIDATRSLEVVPKMDGSLKIGLVDLCLPSKAAVAEVQVLKVGSIRVDVIDRIEKGHCVTANIYFYDSLDNLLTVSDINLLELRHSLESKVISLKPIPSEGRNEIKYTVTGLELGETKLVFLSGRGVNEVQSTPVPIQVFPPLRLLPRNVTLAIGSVYQLKAVGGPQPDSSMEFSPTDQAIAKVSGTGLIEASKLGDIFVTGMSVGMNKVTSTKIVYCKDTVEVHVVPLEGIKIQAPLHRLKVGARIPVWASGIPEQLTPLVLGTIQPNLIFKWHVSSPDIIELRDVFFTTGIEVPDKDRLSMRVKALKPGRATLHLNVTVKGSIVKCPDKSSVVLSDFIVIEVFEEFRLIKPNLGTAAFKPLLLAPDTTFQLVTNKDGIDQITYSVLGYPFTSMSSTTSSSSNKISTALSKQETILTVDSQGLVTTGAASGRALVLLRSDKDFSIDQTIGINVEVKPVYYLMMNVNAKLHVDPNRQITALPRGLDLELVITYHDNTGSEFAATKTDIRIRPSRFDKVHVTRGNVNGSLFTTMVNSGSSVLLVWDEAIPYHSKDYIKFNVEHLMFPDKTLLTVGDVICFSMPLLSEKGEPGTWSSADSDILMIEHVDGIARATGKSGSALVTFHLVNSIRATTAMQVLPTTSIIFLPLDGRNISNSQGDFLVPLLLMNDQLPDRTKNMIAKDNVCHPKDFTISYFPFSCEVRFNSLLTSLSVFDIFIVRPHFSIETGLYSCQFEAIGSPSESISTLQSNITLRAVSGKIISDPLVIPFLPAVFVHTLEIHLSDSQPAAFLTVTGTSHVLSQVQVLTKDSALWMDEKEQASPTTLTYAIRVRARYLNYVVGSEHRLSVNLISELTSQNISIPIIIHLKGDRWSSAPCLGGTKSFLTLSDFDESYFSYNALMIYVSILVMLLAMYYGYQTVIRSLRRDQSLSVYASSPSSPLSSSDRSIFGTSHLSSPNDPTFTVQQPFSNMNPDFHDPKLSLHSPEARLRTRRLK